MSTPFFINTNTGYNTINQNQLIKITSEIQTCHERFNQSLYEFNWIEKFGKITSTQLNNLRLKSEIQSLILDASELSPDSYVCLFLVFCLFNVHIYCL